jgi:3-hydroxybutyryl-CoA dehydrogenase
MIELKERPKVRSENMAFNIRKIGIIGAGQMGSGIAHVSALAGFDVKLNDVSEDQVKTGIATINGNMARQVSRKRISEEERQAALKRIAPAPNFEAFADCDLVVEAATEKEEVKRSIFANLCPHLKPTAIVGRTPRRSRLPGSPPRPTGRNASSAFTS